MIVVTLVVEWALVKDMVSILDFGAVGEMATGALGRLVGRGSEFCSVRSCEIVVG